MEAARKSRGTSTAGTRFEPGPSSGCWLAGHALLAELCQGSFRLLESLDAHAAEDLRRLRELDVAVVDHLHVVSPRVVEAQIRCARDFHAPSTSAARTVSLPSTTSPK